MFQKKKENNLEKEQKAGSVNIVGLGTEIVGNLMTSGDIRVDGKIKGEVISKAKAVIGQTGEVLGDIHANTAEISGSVKGDINTKELLYLKATANITGNVYCNKLVIENGANLTGFCKTGLSQTKSIVENTLEHGRIQGEKEEATA